MVRSIFLVFSTVSTLVWGGAESNKNVVVELQDKAAYELYEHLNVRAEMLADGNSLVKNGENMACSRTSFYPGDLEYRCTLNVLVSPSGAVTGE